MQIKKTRNRGTTLMVMAHQSQMQFFRDVVSAFPSHFAGRVLDIGSLDINGGPHTLFSSSEYVGVDLAPGPNVTHVGRGEEISFPEGYFDVAMSSECFEHNSEWSRTLSNMIRMTRSGGLIVCSAASTGRAEHGTSRSDGGFAAPLAVKQGQEWYRNITPRAIQRVTSNHVWGGWFCVEVRSTSDLLFLGLKDISSEAETGVISELATNWSQLAKSSRYPGSWIRRMVLTYGGDHAMRARAWVRRKLN